MATYDFATLNSSDFEILVCDLLNANLPANSNIKFRTFAEGKDRGIDILYSTPTNDYAQIVQVKHYYRTGYKGMLANLKKSEVQKARTLNPEKYIFATSVDLSVSNVQEIKNLFKPYIRNLYDVYGKADINRLIEENPFVVQNHYKLWLSDTSIFSTILNSDLEFRSSNFVKHELERRLRIYVKTELFDKAQIRLSENKFIIITGVPGVGKTTLAEMLVYKYIAHGYKLTYIVDDIKEAERILTPDDSKQLIYYDDFLGSNAVEINKSKSSETILRTLLKKVQNQDNKLIILTTRSFLLNTAIEESEKLRRFNIKAKASLLELKEYSYYLKEQLLRNHIEVSELKDSLIEVLKRKDIAKFIIMHGNFSPRAVEFITSKEIANDYDPGKYEAFVHSSFDYPDEIWKHAYTEQIKEDDRLLLNTLFSFGETASLQQLEQAFLTRLQFEVETNNKSKEMHAFSKALKRLEGGFIVIKENFIHFINPSLIDFLLNYLREDLDEVKRIATSVQYVSQLTKRLFTLGNGNTPYMPANIKHRLLTNYQSFGRNSESDYDLIQLALVINQYIDDPDKDEVIADIIDNISEWDALNNDYALNLHFKDFMISVKDNSYLNGVLQERLEEIVTELLYGENDLNSSIDLLEELTSSFELDFQTLKVENIVNRLNDLFSDHISQEVEWLEEFLTDESEVGEKIDEIEKIVNRVNNFGLNYEADFDGFDRDWYDIAINNEIRRLMEKND